MSTMSPVVIVAIPELICDGGAREGKVGTQQLLLIAVGAIVIAAAIAVNITVRTHQKHMLKLTGIL